MKRNRDVPPVEELLLALAEAHQKQTAEARKHLQAAVAWMRQGTAPVRIATLAALGVGGPVTALVGLAVRPADPRLEPLHQQTAHELAVLRAEVEKALAASR
jgi:hypothetical protein